MIIKQVKQCTLKKVVTLKTLWNGLTGFINQMKKEWLIVAVFGHLVYGLLKKITPNGSRLGEVGNLEAQSLKLITNFNK